MDELTIQAEVGRRLREVIGRSAKGHALRVNSRLNNVVFNEEGKNDDIVQLVDELIASGSFSSGDKNGLLAMSPDAVRAIASKFAADGDLDEFVNAGRPKTMRRELPEARANRCAKIHAAQMAALPDSYDDDIEVASMVPPSAREIFLNRRRDGR